MSTKIINEFPNEPIQWVGHQEFQKDNGSVSKYNVIYIGYESFFIEITVSEGVLHIRKTEGCPVEFKDPFRFLRCGNDLLGSLVGKKIDRVQYLVSNQDDYMSYGIIIHLDGGEKLLYYENDLEEMVVDLADELPSGLVALPTLRSPRSRENDR